MSDTTPDETTDLDDGSEGAAGDADERVPDESTLLGKVGVEDEVLAELARAEAKMSDPSAPDDPDAAGAQV
jgi:hypothetical protein